MLLVGADCRRLEAVVDDIERSHPGADLLVSQLNLQNKYDIRALVEDFRRELEVVHYHWSSNNLPPSLRPLVEQGLVTPRKRFAERLGKPAVTAAVSIADGMAVTVRTLVLSASHGASTWRTAREDATAARSWLTDAELSVTAAMRYRVPLNLLMHDASTHTAGMEQEFADRMLRLTGPSSLGAVG
ncbi:hypothetical protein FIV34_11785 [Luteibacter pinisoli]|uniref:Uncharacterized protein n=1 Tax=Luteibacter pinisoli TaxID=2589080 RepID=A0A4Y5Z3A7_9GAMM|nr:hypothetical protein [Luteibacter pinisoli]QDE39842.1 hypothetical protein FIV34_11785 [Luteibacter pinisoli]